MKYSTENQNNLMGLVDATARSLINVALACQSMEEGKKSPSAIEAQYKKLRETHRNYEAALVATQLVKQRTAD